MSKRGVRKKVPGTKSTARKAKVGYPPAPWHIVYFKRERRNDPAETRAGKVFLNDECPPSIRAELLAIVKAVADTPPPAFSGGGKWEAMKDDMAGYYQAKADGFEAGGRKHWRLFCRTERDSLPGLPGPSVVIITGLVKPYLTLFTAQEYEAVRALGDEYLGSTPRSVAL
jgi:hypothetical protein